MEFLGKVLAASTLMAFVAQLFGMFYPPVFKARKIVKVFVFVIWVSVLVLAGFGMIIFNYCETLPCKTTPIGGLIGLLVFLSNLVFIWYGLSKRFRVVNA